MDQRPSRRPEPPAIDISWVSCRGVRSSLPFHTPCLYASIFVVSSSAKNANCHRRYHRVKTPTDRAGGENPEWDALLRLYLSDASPAPSPEPEPTAGGKNKKGESDDSSSDGDGDVLLVKFELKAEVAVLGDVHTASAAVPVSDLVADGRTRRVSYQLAGPDGKQPNGVVSFSYAFHGRNSSDDGQSSVSETAKAPCCVTPDASAVAIALPPPTIAVAPRLYPAIEWTLTEQLPVYPPVTAKPFTIADTQYYSPAPPPPLPAPSEEPTSIYPPAPSVEPASVYPPLLETSTSFCSVYPTVVEKESALYPTLDLTPASYYPPAPAHGVEWGYAAAPAWGDRCLYG